MLILNRAQLEVFNAAMRRSFEDRMMAHLRKHFPDLTATMPEKLLRQRIQQEMQIAEQYGFVSECEIAAYISLAFGVSPFIPALKQDWVREILEMPEPPSVRLQHLLRRAEVDPL